MPDSPSFTPEHYAVQLFKQKRKQRDLSSCHEGLDIHIIDSANKLSQTKREYFTHQEITFPISLLLPLLHVELRASPPSDMQTNWS